jgi:hypothetical protein
VTASGGILAAFIIVIVALWALATARHAAGTLSSNPRHPARPVRH